MTRIGVNARALTKPNPAGVSRYAANLLSALAERERRGDDGAEYLLFGVERVPEELRGYDCVRSAGEPAPAHSGLRAHRWEQFELPRAIRGRDLDAFHTPAGQPPLLADPLADAPLVTTIHDISPITHPEWFSTGYAALYRALTPLAVRASDAILTVSGFARDEIVDAYPAADGKTVAAYNGVTPPPEGGEDAAVPDLDGEAFLLFVGSANRRKNLKTLLDAYRRYRTRTDDPAPLALVGPERDVFADPESGYDGGDGVRTLGFVSDERLGWLYRNATAFVFPSLYEGFGLPIVEAMSVGTPVVTSDRGAMAEVAGEAAHLVDPLDAAAMADGVDRVTSDEAYRERLRERGRERAAAFTWDRTAERTRDVFGRVVRSV